MADDLFIFGDASPSQTTDRWPDNLLYAPTPGNLGYSRGSSFDSSPYRVVPQEPSDRLGFLPLDEWDESGEYDVQPPQYVYYIIEWKLALNHKKVGGEMVKGLVVTPSKDIFKKKPVEDILQTTKKPGQRLHYKIYELMRCNISSCQLNSEWCWENPKDRKHYKLQTPHIKRLTDYVDNNGKLEGHDDVPRDIHHDLIQESQTKRKSKKATSPVNRSRYPVNINILPAQTQQVLTAAPSSTRPPPTIESLSIPGPQEQAIRDYYKWLELMATEDDYKVDFQQICQVTLENLLDLNLIIKSPKRQFLINFYIKKGNRIGTILNFMNRIPEWVQHLKTQIPSENIAESPSKVED
ncbi:hypothetical protein DPV78_011722 [Talaromyces pinophilus]|nr:hypothetical protein DPV78_011722 [Talaromyces pinophilus]